jgi:hypothetical protein
MAGLEESRRFIDAGVCSWRAFVERARLDLDPFGLLRDRRSVPGIPRLAARDGDDTPFHTGYVWLGGAARSVTVDLEAWPADAGEAGIEFRIHRQPARQPDEVTCAGSVAVVIRSREHVRVSLPLPAEEACSYAVLGKITAGACWVDDAAVRVSAR